MFVLCTVLREATALMQRSPPTMISLGSGAPNPSTFPFKSIEVEVTDGTSFKLMGAEMKRALQYSQSQGYSIQYVSISNYTNSHVKYNGALLIIDII